METCTKCIGCKPINLALFQELSFGVDHTPGMVGFSVKKMESSETVSRDMGRHLVRALAPFPLLPNF